MTVPSISEQDTDPGQGWGPDVWQRQAFLALCRGKGLLCTPRTHPRVIRDALYTSSFLFIFPLGSAHRWEKGSEGFLTHKAPKRQYFDDLSVSDQEHVGFISCGIHLGLKMKGKHAWQSTARLSRAP